MPCPLFGMLIAVGLLALSAAGPLAVQAQTPAEPTREMALDVTAETLTGGRDNWQAQRLESIWRGAEATTWTGHLTRTRRNAGLRDTQIGAGADHQLTDRWTLSGRLAYSGTARVLPRWDAAAQAMVGVAQATRLGLGGQRRHYDGSGAASDFGVSSVNLLAEHYFGNFRAAWVGGQSRLDGGGTAWAQRVQLDRYYGTGSRWSVVLADGTEIERAEPGPGGVVGNPLRLKVRSVAVFGTHWLAHDWKDWGINWELSSMRTRLPSGNAYDRNGWRLGLRHRY